MVAHFPVKPAEFWDLSWHDVSIYMAALRSKQKQEGLKDEMDWARTRALWVPLKNAFFKKENGGEYQPKDLITLSFDVEEEKPKPIPYKKLKAQLGSKIRRDGK